MFWLRVSLARASSKMSSVSARPMPDAQSANSREVAAGPARLPILLWEGAGAGQPDGLRRLRRSSDPPARAEIVVCLAVLAAMLRPGVVVAGASPVMTQPTW